MTNIKVKKIGENGYAVLGGSSARKTNSKKGGKKKTKDQTKRESKENFQKKKKGRGGEYATNPKAKRQIMGQHHLIGGHRLSMGTRARREHV